MQGIISGTSLLDTRWSNLLMWMQNDWGHAFDIWIEYHITKCALIIVLSIASVLAIPVCWLI